MEKRTITFGTWNNVPIEWIVLKEDDFKMLVVSENGLFKAEFNNNRINRWSESNIRFILNEKFFFEAFNYEEKKKIVNVRLKEEIVKEDVDECIIKSSNNETKDNVFLLSMHEVLSMTKEDRMIENKWWLRTLWSKKTKGVCVGIGKHTFCMVGVEEAFAVRLAIYIKK